MGLTIPKMQRMPGESYTAVQVCFYCGTDGKGQCRNCGASQKVIKEFRVAESMVEPINPDISHLLRPITRTFGGVADEFIIRQDDDCVVYGIHQGEMVVPTRWLTRSSSLPQRSRS